MTTKKRLLIATDSFLPRWDGIARFLHDILPALAEEYDVTVIAPEFKGSAPSFPHVKLIRIPLLGKVRLGDYHPPRPAWRTIRNAVKHSDIIFTQTIGPIGALTVFEAKRHKKHVIAYIHSIEWELFTYSISPKAGTRSILYNLTKHLARFVYNSCDLLLVPSREIADYITHSGIRTQKKILHMGTDVERFHPPHSKKEAKKAIGLNPDAPVIGWVGRLGREKDLQTLYRAFIRVQKAIPSTQLLIVGSGIEEIADMFANRPNIHAVGTKDDPVPYYQAMDIFVLTSLTETSSLTTIEALSCGIPAVSTPVGYIRTYIRPGHNGYLFPRKNSFALAARLKMLITNEPLRHTLAHNARRTAITQFSWEKKLQELKQVLEFF